MVYLSRLVGAVTPTAQGAQVRSEDRGPAERHEHQVERAVVLAEHAGADIEAQADEGHQREEHDQPDDEGRVADQQQALPSGHGQDRSPRGRRALQVAGRMERARRLEHTGG